LERVVEQFAARGLITGKIYTVTVTKPEGGELKTARIEDGTPCNYLDDDTFVIVGGETIKRIR
jgi:hypothetical protein